MPVILSPAAQEEWVRNECEVRAVLHTALDSLQTAPA